MIKHFYGELKMSWLKVILLAIIAGVYTGTILLVPFLKETSFRDIGVFYEWWVIFAVILVVNCEKSWEAMLKCFVFFLISQPIIYGVEILFGSLTLSDAWRFYRQMWLPMTFLTLPGGFIAYFCKKQNVLGSIILGLGNTIQAMMGLYYAGQVVKSFPHHLLSCLVCFVSIFVMTFCIQKEKKYRVITIATTFVLVVGLVVFAHITGRVIW